MQWFTTTQLSDNMELTPEGFLVCRNVPIARCGVQVYRHNEIPTLEADERGWINVEREPSEVFKPESIASFEGKPLTDDHPFVTVTPANHATFAIGHVQNVRRGEATDHDLLFADLFVTSMHGIDLIRRQGKRQVSVGYDAEYERVGPGQGRQRKIVANHLALVREGRCGERCTILDGVTMYNLDEGAGVIGESERPDWLHDMTSDLHADGCACDACAHDGRPGWDADIDYEDAKFDESDHPRDDEGKFTKSGSSSLAKHTQGIAKTLSREERSALENHTRGSGYITPKEKRLVQALVEKHELPEDMVLHRGTVGANLRRLTVGKTYARPSMTSSTVNSKTAKGHSDYVDPGTMELHAPKGTKGLYVQPFTQVPGDEHEFLLGKHKIEVLKKEKIGNRTHVTARIVNDGRWADANFEESEHPRGQPKNAGQFTKGGGGGKSAKAGAAPVKGGKQQGGAGATAAKGEKPQGTIERGRAMVGKLTPTKTRAFTGEQVALKKTLTKQESGAIGEEVVTRWLREHGGLKDARALNDERSNFPVDLIGDHQLVEIKAGLASNGPSAQKWRATIGQPGKAETEWLKTASPDEKAAWNAKKMQAIMDRKNDVVAAYSEKMGKKMKARTVTAIINPDTRTADLFAFDGFHHHLRWNNEKTEKAYVGSYRY